MNFVKWSIRHWMVCTTKRPNPSKYDFFYICLGGTNYEAKLAMRVMIFKLPFHWMGHWANSVIESWCPSVFLVCLWQYKIPSSKGCGDLWLNCVILTFQCNDKILIWLICPKYDWICPKNYRICPTYRFVINWTGFVLKITRFVLNVIGFVLYMTVFVFNMPLLVPNMTGLVGNMTGFVLNITGFVLNMTNYPIDDWICPQ